MSTLDTATCGQIVTGFYWRPIDTAPRDGSMILAFNSAHRECAVVAWQPGDSEEVDHWDDVGIKNAAPSLFFNSNFFQFWMPLPELPRG